MVFPPCFSFTTFLPPLLLGLTIILVDKACAQDDDCKVMFKGSELTFDKCDMDSFKPVEVYYTVKEPSDTSNSTTIDTLFRRPLDADDGANKWVSFGWGYSKMLAEQGKPSTVVVVAYTNASSNAMVRTYELTGKESSDVRQTTNSNGLSDFEADLAEPEADGSLILVARYTHLVSEESVVPQFDTSSPPAIWAVGKVAIHEGQLEYHSSKGARTASGSTGVGRSAARIHSILMSVAWVVFAPIAVLVMTFLKKYEAVAFNIHRSFNTIVTVLTVVGFFLVAFRSNVTSYGNGGGRHQIYGYIVAVLVILQVTGGVLRPAKDADKRRLWFWIHQIGGSVAVVLAFTNVFLGISFRHFSEDRRTTIIWFCLAAIPCALYFILLFTLSCFPRQFPRTPAQCAEYQQRERVIDANDVFT